MLSSNVNVFMMLFVVLALVVSMVKILLPVSLKIGLTDQPGGRKKHDSATPVVGGIAIFLGLSFTVLLFSFPLHAYRVFFAGSAILLFLVCWTIYMNYQQSKNYSRNWARLS